MSKSVTGIYTKEQTQKKGTVALITFVETTYPGIATLHVFNIKPIFGEPFHAIIFGNNISVLGYVNKNLENLFRLRFIESGGKYAEYSAKLKSGKVVSCRTMSEASVIARKPIVSE